MNIENSTHGFDSAAEGYDHLLQPETLRSLGREIRVIDGTNPQAIRLGESWTFREGQALSGTATESGSGFTTWAGMERTHTSSNTLSLI